MHIDGRVGVYRTRRNMESGGYIVRNMESVGVLHATWRVWVYSTQRGERGYTVRNMESGDVLYSTKGAWGGGGGVVPN